MGDSCRLEVARWAPPAARDATQGRGGGTRRADPKGTREHGAGWASSKNEAALSIPTRLPRLA